MHAALLDSHPHAMLELSLLVLVHALFPLPLPLCHFFSIAVLVIGNVADDIWTFWQQSESEAVQSASRFHWLLPNFQVLNGSDLLYTTQRWAPNLSASLCRGVGYTVAVMSLAVWSSPRTSNSENTRFQAAFAPLLPASMDPLIYFSSFALFFGLCVGLERLHRTNAHDRSVNSPLSMPKLQTPIRPWDNTPCFWLLLAKCRYCKARFQCCTPLSNF